MEERIFEAFRSPPVAAAIARDIASLRIDRPVTIMHVCGTHEHTIARAGIRTLLPGGVRLIAGPGCPVCVCPARDIDLALEAAAMENVVVATFGDMMRVPASTGSFERARAAGCDIRAIYSPADAIALARENPEREIVLMAVGFETTAAPIAAALAAGTPPNFSIIVSLRLIPPAMRFLLAQPERGIDGFILPGHVSAIIGREGFAFLESDYGVPAVISGFEPVDVLRAVGEILAQVASGGRGRVRNQYSRVVHEAGNARAREIMDRLFVAGDVSWRGIGVIPASGLVLRADASRLDAERKLGLAGNAAAVDIRPGCQCHRVILGAIEPEACALFGGACTPRDPFGPCMVSSEGTCRARFEYRRAGA